MMLSVPRKQYIKSVYKMGQFLAPGPPLRNRLWGHGRDVIGREGTYVCGAEHPSALGAVFD